MTVFIPDSCWNIWRPQPTMRALRVGPWRRILKITRPPAQQAGIKTIVCTKHGFVTYRQNSFSHCCSQKSFTSTRLFLLFLDAGFDGVILRVNALAPSDPAESLTGLLAAALLDKPAGALWQEEEADELQRCWDDGQTQHVPMVWRERRREKGRTNATTWSMRFTKWGSEYFQMSWRGSISSCIVMDWGSKDAFFRISYILLKPDPLETFCLLTTEKILLSVRSDRQFNC